MMKNEVEVYEIDTTKKYLLSFPYALSNEHREKIQKIFKEWFKSSSPILVMPQGVKLVKVELPEERKEE